MNKKEHNYSSMYLNFISNMLLYNKIQLNDIPIIIRLKNRELYIIAQRVSRNISRKRYLQDLYILKHDASMITNPDIKKRFIDLYHSSKAFIPTK